jgi:hypothetical protein
MPFAPTFALAAPLAGVLALLLVAYVSPLQPYRRYVLPLGAGLSLLGVLFTPWEASRPFLLSRWQPLSLFGTFPVLLADRAVWPLALAWASAVAGSALVQMSRPPGLRLATGGAILSMLTLGLASLWGENLLTVLLAWAGFDLAWGVGMAAAGLPAERVAWGVGGGVAATALLWTAALGLEKDGCSLSWPLMMPDGWGRATLWLAALVRLGLYPFHLVVPAEMRRGHPATAVLLLEPLLAWGLLARTAQAGGFAPDWPLLEALTAATFIIGGFLAWGATDPDRRTVWVGMAAGGGILWAGMRAGSAAAWAAGGAAWTLGLTLLYLGRGWRRAAPGWTVPAVIGGLALLAAPLVSGGVLSPPDALRALLFFLGQALLTAAVAKEVLRTAAEEETVGILPAMAHAAGVVVPVIALALAWGSAPKGTPTGAGWGAWVVGGLAGGGLFVVGERRRWLLGGPFRAVVDSLRWEWAGRLLVRSLGKVADFLDTVADVAEGPGAVLWALATFVLILVVVTRR